MKTLAGLEKTIDGGLVAQALVFGKGLHGNKRMPRLFFIVFGNKLIQGHGHGWSLFGGRMHRDLQAFFFRCSGCGSPEYRNHRIFLFKGRIIIENGLYTKGTKENEHMKIMQVDVGNITGNGFIDHRFGKGNLVVRQQRQ